MTTLPTPTAQPISRDFRTNKPDRSRSFLFPGTAGGMGVLLAISHNEHSKTYGAWAVPQEADGVLHVTEGHHFMQAPAGRYSEKALLAHVSMVLASLPAALDVTPLMGKKLRKVFGPVLIDPLPLDTDGHTPVVTVSDRYGHLSKYACSCEGMEPFAGYSAHVQQRARFDAHLADVAPQASDDEWIGEGDGAQVDYLATV